MATFSTHILSSLDGTHLPNVVVSIVEISPNDANRKVLFQKKTDSGGRVSVQFSPKTGKNFEYEVVISIPKSFDVINQKCDSIKNAEVSTISVRMKFENKDATYHMPFILSPYGFSSWVSR